jgi:DNA-directed RNA polymerase specialized sigma subunit
MDLAGSLAKKKFYELPHFIRPAVQLDDLVAAARVGLYKAALRFKKGTAEFSTYAHLRIEGAIKEELRRLDPLTRGQRTEVKGGKVGHVTFTEYQDGTLILHASPNRGAIASAISAAERQSAKLPESEYTDARYQQRNKAIEDDQKKLCGINLNDAWESTKGPTQRERRAYPQASLADQGFDYHEDEAADEGERGEEDV